MIWLGCPECYTVYDMFKDFDFPVNFHLLPQEKRIEIVAKLLKEGV